MSEIKKQDLEKIQPGDTVLLMVHPGSACGSANFNIGQIQADQGRAGLIEDIDHAVQNNMHIIVLSGDFDDEIPYFPDLNKAYGEAIKPVAGRVRKAVYAGDPDQIDVTQEIVKGLGGKAKDIHFLVSGCCLLDADKEVKEGCVGSVYETLKSCSLQNILISSNSIEFDNEELDNDIGENKQSKPKV